MPANTAAISFQRLQLVGSEANSHERGERRRKGPISRGAVPVSGIRPKEKVRAKNWLRARELAQGFESSGAGNCRGVMLAGLSECATRESACTPLVPQVAQKAARGGGAFGWVFVVARSRSSVMSGGGLV